MVWFFAVFDVLLVVGFGVSIWGKVKRDERRDERERQYYEQYRRNSD
jgi:hypothetical protein